MRRILAVLGILILSVSGVLMHAQLSGPRELVGTWTLSAIERIATGGTSTTLPLPRGLLVFDAAGHAFELAEHGRRTPYAGNQPTPAEGRAVYDNYSGFWGGYTVDRPAKKITYRPKGAISPNAMNQDVVRSFEMTGDRLIVTATSGEPDGQEGVRWTWDRVPPLANLTQANRHLIGFWEHIVERRVNAVTGAVLSETRRAPSIIVYTPSGYVGVHFPPLNRTPFSGSTPTDDEARAAIAGVVSYYGSYTLHPDIVFHHRLIILGAAPGDSLKRFYEIAGDELRLRFPPVMNQGQEVRTVVTLKRLSGAAEMLGAR